MSLQHLGGDTYRVRIYNRNTGGYYQKRIHGKRAAQLHEADMKVKLQRGTLFDPREGKITFDQYARHDIANRRLAPNTRAKYLEDLDRLRPFWGQRTLESLRHSDAVALQSRYTEKYKGNGAYNALVLARSVMHSAFLDRIIERSPFVGLKLGKPREKRPVELPTWDEIRTLVEGRAHDKNFARLTKTQVVIAVMAGTGMRAAEVAGLDAQDINFLRREVTVRQSLQFLSTGRAGNCGYSCGGYYLKEVKSGAGQDRVVPVPQWMLDVITRWLAEKPRDSEELPWGRPDATETRETRLVFGRTAPTTLSSAVRNAAKQVGASFSPHDIRKLFATELEQSGLPLTTLQGLLGHEGQGVTSLYLKVDQKTMMQARSILEQAWNGAEPSPPERLREVI